MIRIFAERSSRKVERFSKVKNEEHFELADCGFQEAQVQNAQEGTSITECGS